MYCQNCKATLSCGCQKRAATNGASCCSNCVAAFNAKLLLLKTNPPVPNTPK